MGDYYQERLHGTELERCYKIAPPRIQQYLSAEIGYSVRVLKHDGKCLELGCGYGRALRHFAPKAKMIVGIDTSQANIELGLRFLRVHQNCHLAVMDALDLAFRDRTFDNVICIQNGISAFHVDKRSLVRESIRVTKGGGFVLYSSYSEKIWPQRLMWFEAQAEAGLIGPIDYEKTHDGTITCRDGFTATTVGKAEFEELMRGLPVTIHIEEVDDSSIFCLMEVREDD
jgi:SAM-dependent methyltransferase